jgi:hypothetical protein
MALRGAGLLIAGRNPEGWQVLLGFRLVHPFFGNWVVLGGQRKKVDRDPRATALRAAGEALAGARKAGEVLRELWPPELDAAAMPEHEYVSGASRWHTFLLSLAAPVAAAPQVSYPYSGAGWFPVTALPLPTHDHVVQALAHFGLAGTAPTP